MYSTVYTPHSHAELTTMIQRPFVSPHENDVSQQTTEENVSGKSKIENIG